MRVLLLHAAVGGGHKSAAEAVRAAFESMSPAPTVQTLDVLDLMPGPIARLYEGSYSVSVARSPWVYGMAFRRTSELATGPVLRPLRKAFNRAISRELVEAARGFRPHVIVCTHFMPLNVMVEARRRGKIDAPVACVVTDYGVHGYWVERRADRYFVGAPESALALTRRGVARERIEVSGIPVRPGFSDPPGREAARRALGLDPDRTVLLVMAGGLGMGPVERIVRELGRAGGARCEQVVVCGKNEELRASVEGALRREQLPGRALGFTDQVPLLMSAADLVVTKPGGLTTTEALAIGRPMMLFEAMPGQEAMNAQHHVRCGAAVMIRPGTAGAALERLLDSPMEREGLARRARELGRPAAAHRIAEASLGLIPVRAMPAPAIAAA